jgi:hypothetical protein
MGAPSFGTWVLTISIGIVLGLSLGSWVARFSDSPWIGPARIALEAEACAQAQAAGWTATRSTSDCSVLSRYRTGSRYLTLLGKERTLRIPHARVIAISESH